MRKRTTVVSTLLLGVVALVISDYVVYHSRDRAAMEVVHRLGGRAGSLMGWPLGRELRITFDRPLTAEELSELSIVNELAGRDWVGVAFLCDLDPDQLRTAKSALPECLVFQVAPADGTSTP